MHFILLLAIAFLHPDSENVFSVQAELQGLYEQALKAPTFDWMTQSIQKLSLTPGGATAIVNVTTVRTSVDNEGRYGPKGASHTLTETTPFRDAWVKMADSWKLHSREQLGRAKVSVAASQYEKYLRDYAVGR